MHLAIIGDIQKTFLKETRCEKLMRDITTLVSLFLWEFGGMWTVRFAQPTFCLVRKKQNQSR